MGRISKSRPTTNQEMKKEGEGEITYRFMLGKDAALDYNAERNHHYKLTLKFKGWANDVDWHIDYRKEPETKLRFPHPFYISYLYGQTAMIPLEFDAPKDVKNKKYHGKNNNQQLVSIGLQRWIRWWHSTAI